MAPSEDPISNGYHCDDEEENGGWKPIAHDPNLLANWLNGKSREEALKKWLDSKYPQGISDSVLDDIVNHVKDNDKNIEPVSSLEINKNGSSVIEAEVEEEGSKLKKKINEIEFLSWSRAKDRFR